MQKIFALFIIILVVEFLLATICGPHSCEWGNDVYFYAGIGFLIVSFTLPLFRTSWKPAKRIGIAVLFTLSASIVWFAGFMICDFRIMCKMF